MPWSLDWFAAEKLARSGQAIRRAGWTDHVWVQQGAFWFSMVGETKTLIATTDYTETDLRARDWTDQPFESNPCAATPAYNTSPVTYGSWDDKPIFTAPPPPGFPDPAP